MIICETLLISIIGILGFYVTITDIKHGIIQNKRLLQAGTIGFFINVVYYSRFAYGFFQLYISNLIIMSILAVALYMIHFWAAGDSKLLIVLMFLFPARFYDFGKQVIAPGIYGFILIFLLAYVYLFGLFCDHRYVGWRECEDGSQCSAPVPDANGNHPL